MLSIGARVGKKWQEEPSASCNVRDLWLCLIIRSDLVQRHMRVDQGFSDMQSWFVRSTGYPGTNVAFMSSEGGFRILSSLMKISVDICSSITFLC